MNHFPETSHAGSGKGRKTAFTLDSTHVSSKTRQVACASQCTQSILQLRKEAQKGTMALLNDWWCDLKSSLLEERRAEGPREMGRGWGRHEG